MKRWITAQQVGLAAFSVTLSLSDSEFLRYFETHASRLSSLLQAYSRPESSALATLPPAVLRQLASALAELEPDSLEHAGLNAYAAPLHEAVAQLLPGFRRNGRPPVGDLNEDSGPEAKQQSPWPAIEAFSHVLMDGSKDAYWVCRTGRYLFDNATKPSIRSGAKRTWRAIEEDLAALNKLDEGIAGFRDPVANSEARLKAAIEIAQVIDGVPWCEQLENRLFHGVFTWPLLAVDAAGVPGAVAMPVMVDVEFPTPAHDAGRRSDPNPDVRNLGPEHGDVAKPSPVNQPAPAIMLDTAFLASLKSAQEAAKDLWLGGLNTYGDFRRHIGHAKAVYDFKIAREVARGIAASGTVPINGASAGVYFSQSVLTKLIGQAGSASSMITGEIGKRTQHPDGTPALDRFVDPVDGVGAKLRYAFSARMASRIVVPARPVGDTPDETGTEISKLLRQREDDSPDDAWHRQTAEVVRRNRLSQVADIVQKRPWRKKSYVRCPEVEWAIWQNELIDPDDFAVTQVLKRLQNCNDCVVQLNDVGPRAVFSALAHVDRAIRTEGCDFKTIFPKPALNWSAVRVSWQGAAIEEDAEFWHIVWSLCGASPERFDQVLQERDRSAITDHVRWALNGMSPARENRQHRAPDVIVLLDTRQMEQNWSGWQLTPNARPHAPWPILGQIAQRGLSISRERMSCPRLSAALGRTRIILLPKGASDELPRSRKPQWGLAEYDWRLLRPLATYRWGFTQSMAAMVWRRELEVTGAQVKRELERLSDPSVDALRANSGWYHIPKKLHDQVIESDHDRRTYDREVVETPVASCAESGGLQHKAREYISLEGLAETKKLLLMADRHWNCALAVAPYAAAEDVPALAYEDAFVPEYVLEAQYHLEQALQHYDHMAATDPKLYVDVNEFKTPIRSAMQRLARAAMVSPRGIAHRLSGAGVPDADHDVVRIRRGLVDDESALVRSSSRQLPPHPRDLIDLASAIVRNDRHNHDKREVASIYRRAFDAANDYATISDPDDGDANAIRVLCNWANYLFNWGDPSGAAELDAEAWKLRCKWHNVPGDWIERQGDQEQNPAKAAGIYALGLRYATSWHQLPYKALGASSKFGSPRDDVAPNVIRAVRGWINMVSNDPYMAAESCVKAIAKCQRDRRNRNVAVKARVEGHWLRAARVLGEKFGRGQNWPVFLTLEWLATKQSTRQPRSRTGRAAR